MEFLTRPITAADFASIYLLDQACFAPGIAWSKAELWYFLRHPRNFGIAAQAADGKIAGFAIAGAQRRRGSVVGRLITIDVDPELRRHGVGNQLLHAIEARLRDLAAESLTLEVAADNPTAQAFYHRHGFVSTGRIPGYYLGRTDALVMEKQLRPPPADSAARIQ